MKKGLRIDLGDFLITADEHNFILSEKSVWGEGSQHAGQDRLYNQQFFPCLKHCCTEVLRRRLRKCDAVSVQELLDVLSRLSALIREIKAGIGKDYDI